jgi:DMSO reductase anchor subunit
MSMPNAGGGGLLGRGTYVTNAAAPTAAEAAFGPAYTMPGGGGGLLGFLTPNDPAGIVTWLGIGAVVGLLFLHHSLPR